MLHFPFRMSFYFYYFFGGSGGGRDGVKAACCDFYSKVWLSLRKLLLQESRASKGLIRGGLTLDKPWWEEGGRGWEGSRERGEEGKERQRRRDWVKCPPEAPRVWLCTLLQARSLPCLPPSPHRGTQAHALVTLVTRCSTGTGDHPHVLDSRFHDPN